MLHLEFGDSYHLGAVIFILLLSLVYVYHCCCPKSWCLAFLLLNLLLKLVSPQVLGTPFCVHYHCHCIDFRAFFCRWEWTVWRNSPVWCSWSRTAYAEASSVCLLVRGSAFLLQALDAATSCSACSGAISSCSLRCSWPSCLSWYQVKVQELVMNRENLV